MVKHNEADRRFIMRFIYEDFDKLCSSDVEVFNVKQVYDFALTAQLMKANEAQIGMMEVFLMDVDSGFFIRFITATANYQSAPKYQLNRSIILTHGREV